LNYLKIKQKIHFQEEPQRSHSLQQNESEVARAERLRQRQQEELRTAQRLMDEMRRQESEVTGVYTATIQCLLLQAKVFLYSLSILELSQFGRAKPCDMH
jgi:hypothetical protein